MSREAEVQQFHARFRDQNISGLQVAVDDAVTVRVVERASQLAGKAQGLGDGDRPLQRMAVHILHDQVVFADVVESADVRMAERGDGPCLALKAFTEPFERNLDGYDAVEPSIARFVDAAHSARADGHEDLVRTETCMGCERSGAVHLGSLSHAAPLLAEVGNSKGEGALFGRFF